MNKKKAVFFLSGLLSLTSLGAILAIEGAPSSVSAGSSIRYAISENSVSEGRINTGDIRASGEVNGLDSSIRFGEGKAIAKMRINNYKDAGLRYVYRSSFDLKLTSLETDGAFRIVSGLPGISSPYNEKGVLSFDIEKTVGNIFLSVTEHYGNDLKTTLLEKQQIKGLEEGKEASFSIDVETKGALTFAINGNSLLKEAPLLESGTGYFGFISEGNNDILLSSCVTYGYTYNAPENVPSYLETFDKEVGSYNADYFYSASDASPVSPSYLAVDKDVGALHFSNVSNGHITTRYMYSNFSMEFEIPQIRKEAKYDENGTLLAPITTGFGIGWGIEAPLSAAGQTWANSTWVQFENISINSALDHTVPSKNPRLILYKATKALHLENLSKNFFSPNEKRVPTIKLSLVDGVLDIYVRYEDETSYGSSIFHFDLGETAEGYLRILTLGDASLPATGLKNASITDFSIDNLAIENLDAPSYRQETVVGYRPNGISGGENYHYETVTDDSDLIGNKLSTKNQKKTKGYAILSCFSLISLSLIVTFTKRRSL